MYGRLGNQMFRYAMARKLQIKYYQDEKIVLNYNNISGNQLNDGTFKNELDNFNVVSTEIYEKKGKTIIKETDFQQKILLSIVKVYLRKNSNNMREKSMKLQKVSKFLNLTGLYWNPIGFQKIYYSEKKNKILSGNFESPKFFDDIYSILKTEFTPKHEILSHNLNMYNKIKNSNSICLSIRRGDFIENNDISKLHNVTNIQYFQNAIEIMENRIKKPVFFIFSDDIEWAKKNIKTDSPTFFERGNDPVWEKLRLMYSCKHFIISNSTFSWWSQYLSNNDGKIVIAPKKWFNNDYDYELLHENFIKI